MDSSTVRSNVKTSSIGYSVRTHQTSQGDDWGGSKGQQIM